MVPRNGRTFVWSFIEESHGEIERGLSHTQRAMPVPGPSFDGPAGTLRFSRALVAELLLGRPAAAIGGGPFRPA